MKQIWKFPLTKTDLNKVEMPKGANILSCQMQSGIPMIWAEINPNEQQKETRTFEIFGTGHDINGCAPLVFIATVQLPNGIVLHVFEHTK